MLTAVVLTLDEEAHIERALNSIASIADRIVVVDSGSKDRTVELAEAAGAEVFENPWVNHARQMNWALDQLPPDTDWVMRLDADEVVTTELAFEIREKLGNLPAEISGVYIPRRMAFLRRPIRHGGVFPVRLLRIFRHGCGRCEDRWMDEHIKIDGGSTEFSGEILDDSLQTLSRWTEKHNGYASREVIDILNQEYRFAPYESLGDLRTGGQAGTKRWLKENAYARFPGGIRAFLYFFYRYIIRLGFLDGKEGTAFHVLQGFWYRFLVDAKLYEVRMYMQNNDADVVTAIDKVLGIKVDP